MVKIDLSDANITSCLENGICPYCGKEDQTIIVLSMYEGITYSHCPFCGNVIWSKCSHSHPVRCDEKKCSKCGEKNNGYADPQVALAYLFTSWHGFSSSGKRHYFTLFQC
jgi:predicted RNA-binding Zn-ribbon protein involved in translation (DUF1610 family)